MSSFFKNIAKVVLIPLLATLHIAGYTLPQTTPIVAPTTLGAFNPTGAGTYELGAGIGATDATVTLTSFTEPISGIPYTMSYLNSSIEYATIDPQYPTKTEFISFTGITQNANGSATLTGVSRGLGRSYPFTASTTLATSHSGQAVLVLSNSPQLYQQYAALANDVTITGNWSFPAPTQPNNAATKSYVDGTAFGGIGGATETATGTVQIATNLQAASSTKNGTIGRLVVPSSIATSTYNVNTAPLSVVVTQNNGKIDPNFLALSTTTPIGSFPAYDIGTNYAIFTNAGTTTWAIPSGVSRIKITVIGAGGGSGGVTGSSGNVAAGAGSGAYCWTIQDVTATTSIQIGVGAGGVAGSAGNNAGNIGGTTMVSSYCTAYGGLGSTGSAATSAGAGNAGLGGNAVGGIINSPGRPGGYAGNGGNGIGGSSFIGTGGGPVSAGNNGATGTYGGGASGANSAGSTQGGGTGAAGLVLITW